MKAKKKAARPVAVVRDVHVDVKLDRWFAFTSPSKLMESGGISFDRLEQIESEIERGVPIDGALRLEIRQLIAHVLSLHDDERGRGAPADATLGNLARIVGVLHEKYEIPVATAAKALVRDPESDEGFNRAKSIGRAYGRLKKIGGHYLASESLVQRALARIRARKRT